LQQLPNTANIWIIFVLHIAFPIILVESYSATIYLALPRTKLSWEALNFLICANLMVANDTLLFFLSLFLCLGFLFFLGLWVYFLHDSKMFIRFLYHWPYCSVYDISVLFLWSFSFLLYVIDTNSYLPYLVSYSAEGRIYVRFIIKCYLIPLLHAPILLIIKETIVSHEKQLFLRAKETLLIIMSWKKP
jgi:hypothetical protein